MNSFKNLIVLVATVFFTFCLHSCNTTTTTVPAGSWTEQGKSAISPNPPSYLPNYKTKLATIIGISESMRSFYFIKRDSTFSSTLLTTSTGTPIQNVDSRFIKLLCFDNPAYSSINTNAQINGWASAGVNHISNTTFSGIVRNINGQLSQSTATSLSFVLTYFPDGVYTIINNVDETLNQIGNYQPVIENGIMTGIIYKQQFVGINFSKKFDESIPNYTSNPLSYGVWGIDENYFFPLFNIDVTNIVFLRMSKFSY